MLTVASASGCWSPSSLHLSPALLFRPLWTDEPGDVLDPLTSTSLLPVSHPPLSPLGPVETRHAALLLRLHHHRHHHRRLHSPHQLRSFSFWGNSPQTSWRRSLTAAGAAPPGVVSSRVAEAPPPSGMKRFLLSLVLTWFLSLLSFPGAFGMPSLHFLQRVFIRPTVGTFRCPTSRTCMKHSRA